MPEIFPEFIGKELVEPACLCPMGQCTLQHRVENTCLGSQWRVIVHRHQCHDPRPRVLWI